jgi:acyl-CoA thioesterase
MDEAAQNEKLRQLFCKDNFAERLGIELLEFRPGYARTRMRVAPSHLNFLGHIHGGAIFGLLDYAFAAASNSDNYSSVAISMSVQFITAPKPEGLLYAEAREVEKSRKLGLYEMTVRDEDGKLICRSDGRVYRIGEPILAEGKAES